MQNFGWTTKSTVVTAIHLKFVMALWDQALCIIHHLCRCQHLLRIERVVSHNTRRWYSTCVSPFVGDKRIRATYLYLPLLRTFEFKASNGIVILKIKKLLILSGVKEKDCDNGQIKLTTSQRIIKIIPQGWCFIQRGHEHFSSTPAVCFHYHLPTKHTSSIQNFALQVGQGEVLANHPSGWCWSWRLANHLPIQSIHHIGRQ